MSYVPRAFNRLTDNDRHFGPLTIGERSNFHKSYGLDLRSGNDEHPGTSLNLHFAGWWVRLAIATRVVTPEPSELGSVVNDTDSLTNEGEPR
jgi:hypothetical protein